MPIDKKIQEEIKRALGEKAATLIFDGMLVGLGSGSTSECFIKSLAKRCKAGLAIKAVSSSERSKQLAKESGIEVIEMTQVTQIDLTIDGADEIDSHWRMIKGGGGAHVREKILASASKKLMILVDESKVVEVLGKCGLPVEIIPFGYRSTLFRLEKKRFLGKIRTDQKGELFITDNGNYLYDLHTPLYFQNPEISHEHIINTPGVVDSGFFFDLASNVAIGYANGEIEMKVGKDARK